MVGCTVVSVDRYLRYTLRVTGRLTQQTVFASVGCLLASLTSQQHASVSQRRLWLDTRPSAPGLLRHTRQTKIEQLCSINNKNTNDFFVEAILGANKEVTLPEAFLA